MTENRLKWFHKWQYMLIHYFHIGHNAPCLPPKIWHNHCFRFLLGITVVPREIQDNGYANFFFGGGGYTRYIMAYVKIVNLEKWPLHQGLEAGSWSRIPAPFHENPPDLELLSSVFFSNTTSRAKILANPSSPVAVKSRIPSRNFRIPRPAPYFSQISDPENILLDPVHCTHGVFEAI